MLEILCENRKEKKKNTLVTLFIDDIVSLAPIKSFLKNFLNITHDEMTSESVNAYNIFF